MSCVLDSSAVLALLFQEPGQDVVRAGLRDGAAISAVNFAEVMTRLVKDGMAEDIAAAVLSALPMILHDLDRDLAIQTGSIFAETQPFGLSLGDRACLALGKREKLPVLTADTIWSRAAPSVSVEVRLIR